MEKSGTLPKTGGFEKFKAVCAKINHYIDLVGRTLFHLRKPVLAAPVVYYALRLASYNQSHLPPQVGINLQATGEFASFISRQLAVMGPLGLTLGCLLLMFLSKRATFPWIISVFTLALPLLLLMSNLYPN